MSPVNVLQCLIMLSSYFPYFGKMKKGLCDLHAVCVSLLSAFEYLNQYLCNFVCTYIMAPEPFPTAYFINPSHQSVCVSPPSFLGNSSINAFPRKRNIVGCVGFFAVRVVSEEPLVIVMLPFYHFIITCAVSWPYFGAVFI
jgi:hypothetical protein